MLLYFEFVSSDLADLSGLSLFTGFNDISVGSLGSLIHTVLLFVNNISFVVLARIFSTMFKRNGERGHHCFVPDLKRKSLSVLSLSIMFDVDSLIDTFWQTKKIMFYFQFTTFYYAWILRLITWFFYIFLVDQLIFENSID